MIHTTSVNEAIQRLRSARHFFARAVVCACGAQLASLPAWLLLLGSLLVGRLRGWSR